MSCVSKLFVSADEQHSADDHGSWKAIIAAIRGHASKQDPNCRKELEEWADLLEGLAELESS